MREFMVTKLNLAHVSIGDVFKAENDDRPECPRRCGGVMRWTPGVPVWWCGKCGLEAMPVPDVPATQKSTLDLSES